MLVAAAAADPPETNVAAALRERCEALKAELARIGELRQGSLVERYRRCGRASCGCAVEGAVGHGPSWSLTRRAGSKNITFAIPSAAVERTRAQIAEYQRFKALASELLEASEQLCQAQLGRTKAASQEVAKKGASRRPSKSKSSRRLKR